MTNKSTREIGKWGEEQAVAYLRTKGYKIVATNYYFGNKELDIVAELDNFLVVIEVKTRESVFFEHPEDAVSNAKIRNIIDATEGYIEEFDVNKEIRFDIIGVILKGQGQYEIEHFEDAFLPPLM